MVICKRCQSENRDQTRFCTFCGGRLPSRVELPGAATAARAPQPATGAAARAGASDPEGRARYVQKVVYQHFIRAKELIRERKFDQAIREFKMALEVSPGEPTITEMLAKTLAAQKKARVALGEPAPAVAFRPAPAMKAPTKASLPAEVVADLCAPPSGRKPSVEQWFRTAAAVPALYPSMVLDVPTHDRLWEVAVSLFILGGLAFFAFLLTI
ncbi:MAG: zinc ribbon domain-containing protein [Candidatus Riflebacteria bacterium]|nr:zinc ribbon domain-containing protein [Candidatus Riflebacteria bacterium]